MTTEKPLSTLVKVARSALTAAAMAFRSCSTSIGSPADMDQSRLRGVGLWCRAPFNETDKSLPVSEWRVIMSIGLESSAREVQPDRSVSIGYDAESVGSWHLASAWQTPRTDTRHCLRPVQPTRGTCGRRRSHRR